MTILLCAHCDADLGEDPHWHDADEAWVCEPHCPTCSPCPVCDGPGHLTCDHGSGVDCGCPLWECPQCAGSGVLPISSLGGEDRGSGGRDSAAAAQSVDGASGAGSTAGGADAARTQHAPVVGDIR